MVERLHVKQPTVTHHLKLLAAAGLIKMKKEGREHLYSLATESECFSECGLLIGLK
jgi:DNA-binding transcriptional ArsR family regulator